MRARCPEQVLEHESSGRVAAKQLLRKKSAAQAAARRVSLFKGGQVVLGAGPAELRAAVAGQPEVYDMKAIDILQLIIRPFDGQAALSATRSPAMVCHGLFSTRATSSFNRGCIHHFAMEIFESVYRALSGSSMVRTFCGASSVRQVADGTWVEWVSPVIFAGSPAGGRRLFDQPPCAPPRHATAPCTSLKNRAHGADGAGPWQAAAAGAAADDRGRPARRHRLACGFADGLAGGFAGGFAGGGVRTAIAGGVAGPAGALPCAGAR